MSAVSRSAVEAGVVVGKNRVAKSEIKSRKRKKSDEISGALVARVFGGLMAKNDRTVSRRSDGTWANKKGGAEKAASLHQTQAGGCCSRAQAFRDWRGRGAQN